jgi:transposase-like protein
MAKGVAVPLEAIATLRRRLAALPGRHPDRQELLASTAGLYNVSRATLYRLLRGDRRPKDAHRADRGQPRVMGAAEIERWCEIVAAMKVRTTNKRENRELRQANEILRKASAYFAQAELDRPFKR